MYASKDLMTHIYTEHPEFEYLEPKYKKQIVTEIQEAGAGHIHKRMIFEVKKEHICNTWPSRTTDMY